MLVSAFAVVGLECSFHIFYFFLSQEEADVSRHLTFLFVIIRVQIYNFFTSLQSFGRFLPKSFSVPGFRHLQSVALLLGTAFDLLHFDVLSGLEIPPDGKTQVLRSASFPVDRMLAVVIAVGIHI